MAHRLPSLPYDYRDLEPFIDKRTMVVHHDKHHQAYVDNLNKTLEGYPDLQSKTTMELLSSLDSVPEEIRTAVRNNAGGHTNHSMFWPSMGFRTLASIVNTQFRALHLTFQLNILFSYSRLSRPYNSASS